MTIELFANNARTALVAAINTTPAAGTSESWLVVSSAGRFPTADGHHQFRAVVASPTVADTDPEMVIVTHTDVDSTHMTVSRGAEGSTIKHHAVGDFLTACLSAYHMGHAELFIAVEIVGGSAIDNQYRVNVPIQPGGNFGLGDFGRGSVTTVPLTIGAATDVAWLQVTTPYLPTGTLTLTSAELAASNMTGSQKLHLLNSSSAVLSENTAAHIDFGSATVVETVGADLAWNVADKAIKTTAGGLFMASAQVQLQWVLT